MKSREQKRTEANARQLARPNLSPEEKWAELDRRHGRGLGARKERRKLLPRLGWSQPMIDAEFPLPIKK